jgi:hypothetical protein
MALGRRNVGCWRNPDDGGGDRRDRWFARFMDAAWAVDEAPNEPQRCELHSSD